MSKKIIRVRCIDANDSDGHLKHGKEYDAFEYDRVRYQIEGMVGTTWFKRRFEIVSDTNKTNKSDTIPAPPPVMSMKEEIDVEEDRLRAILTKPCHPESCPKCGAPKAVCQYH